MGTGPRAQATFDASLAAGLSGLAHARQANDTTAVLDAASLLQTMASRSPEAAAALPPPQQLLEMARTTHQTALAAVLLPTFAVQAVAAGDVAAAARWCHQGLELFGLQPSSLLTALTVFAAVEIAVATGDHELAARLHGWLLDSEALLYAIIPPHFATSHQSAITGLRHALGADSFATHAAEGATLAGPSILRELDAYLARIGTPQPATPASLDKVRTQQSPTPTHRPAGRGGEASRPRPDQQGDRPNTRRHAEDRHAPHRRHLSGARRAWA